MCAQILYEFRYWCADWQFQVWISANMHFIHTDLCDLLRVNYWQFERRIWHFLAPYIELIDGRSSKWPGVFKNRFSEKSLSCATDPIYRDKSYVVFTSRQSGTVLPKQFGSLIKIWTIQKNRYWESHYW